MPTTPTEPIRILLVDDHVIVRAGLRMLIESQPGLKVIGEAGNRADALALAASEQPDIILLDIDLENENGLDFVSELLGSKSKVLVLTGVRNHEEHRRAFSLGVAGLILKDKATELLIEAIEKVHKGEIWLDQKTITTMFARTPPANDAAKTDPEAAKIALLSPREREVIALVGKGLTNRQIADQLFISQATVRHHVESVYSKVGVTSRFQLILYAYKHGPPAPTPKPAPLD